MTCKHCEILEREAKVLRTFVIELMLDKHELQTELDQLIKQRKVKVQADSGVFIEVEQSHSQR